VKNEKQNESQVFHSDLYGLRENKYDWLAKNEFSKENYTKIQPQSPYYFLVKRDTEKIKQYLKWKKINEIFPVNSVGIVTARDTLTIQWTEQEMWQTVLNFSRLEPELARQAYGLGKDVRDWKVDFAQKDLKNSGPDRKKIFQILYRPFDIRYTYYTGKSRGFHCMPRPEVMRHMLEERNLGLITHKREELNVPWSHAFITSFITEHGVLSSKTTNYHFPLYVCDTKEKNNPGTGATVMMVFEPRETYGKKPNIAPIILKKLHSAFGKIPTPEDILYYIYGVFYSNIYRETYAEFLRIDFPRVPFTANFNLFKSIGKLGKELTDLHLLKSPALDPPVAKYQGSGDNDCIEKITYKEDERRIFINKDKYFEGIAPEVWNYHIGGYQVLHKYLKDRKRRIMDDAPHYCRIVTALSKTIELQDKIDAMYPEIEKELIDF